jgi:hypothetical protein
MVELVELMEQQYTVPGDVAADSAGTGSGRAGGTGSVRQQQQQPPQLRLRWGSSRQC